MWTHADTMRTHVDCPQKCKRMGTMNADKDVPSMGLRKLLLLPRVVLHTLCNQDRSTKSWGCTQLAVFLQLLHGGEETTEFLSGHCRQRPCRQLRTKDVDRCRLSAIMQKNAGKLGKNTDKCGHVGMKKL